MTIAQNGGKVVSLTHRPLFTPRKHSWYSFLLRGWVYPRSIVRSEGLCQWKIPVTPSGIEPATIRYVAQHLNHCATAVPLYFYKQILIFINKWVVICWYDIKYRRQVFPFKAKWLLHMPPILTLHTRYLFVLDGFRTNRHYSQMQCVYCAVRNG